MLRITVEDGEHDVVLRLEGKVAGPWVTELQHAWNELVSSVPQKKISVDLRRVSYIDEAGRDILAAMGRSHAEFLADSPLMKYFAEAALCGTRQSK